MYNVNKEATKINQENNNYLPILKFISGEVLINIATISSQQQGEILNRYSNAIIYSEQFTGTTTQRPIFNEVVKNLIKGDTLVVCKLDRLARSTMEGIELFHGIII